MIDFGSLFFTLAVIFIAVGCFALSAYLYMGLIQVKEKLWSRSIKIGAATLGIEITSGAVLKLLSISFLGPIVSAILVYLYISKYLTVSIARRVTYSILMPVTGFLIGSPVMWLVFRAIA